MPGYVSVQARIARTVGGVGSLQSISAEAVDEMGLSHKIGEFSEREIGELIAQLQGEKLPLVCDMILVQALVSLATGVGANYLYDLVRTFRAKGGFIGSSGGGDPPSKILVLLGEAKATLASVVAHHRIPQQPQASIREAIDKVDRAIELLLS